MLKLHDTLSRQEKAFPPGPGREVTIYACGPTVYHYAHIGNLRTFLTVDLLRRHLESKGEKVKLVMNITDVGHMLNDADTGEDRMAAASAREGKTPKEIADFYEKAFFDDLDAVGFKRANVHPRATENIPQMVALIEKLIAAGKAYVTAKNDVYYSVASFRDYGKLSGNTVEDLVAGSRVEVKEDKRHPADFALWINNPDHVMQWNGPQGIQGYPGWHIECSAMAKEYLGETIDLHVGGEDLKFPHHECEIAQSEGASGKPFARHWLHVTHLLVEGEKMSKSKGNFYTLSDLLAKGYSAMAVRYLLLSAHYRSQLNFTLEGLDAAEKAVGYLRGLDARLREAGAADASGQAEEGFDAAMDDDLNVSKALAILMDAAKAANRRLDEGGVTADEASAALGAVRRMATDVMGLDLSSVGEEAPVDVQALADERAQARKDKDFAASDRLRDAIATKGWTVEDTPQGQRLKKS